MVRMTQLVIRKDIPKSYQSKPFPASWWNQKTLQQLCLLGEPTVPRQHSTWTAAVRAFAWLRPRLLRLRWKLWRERVEGNLIAVKLTKWVGLQVWWTIIAFHDIEVMLSTIRASSIQLKGSSQVNLTCWTSSLTITLLPILMRRSALGKTRTFSSSKAYERHHTWQLQCRRRVLRLSKVGTQVGRAKISLKAVRQRRQPRPI